MEELTKEDDDSSPFQREEEDNDLPDLTEYGIRTPFRFAIVGQTDSGKTYSILQRWLGGKISFWTVLNGSVREVKLRHCLYCNNGNVPSRAKRDIVENFVQEGGGNSDQRVFHSDHFPTRDELFEFVGSTSSLKNEEEGRTKKTTSRKRTSSGESKEKRITYQAPNHRIVYGEDNRLAPHRILVLDDLMVEAFEKPENRDLMQLLMTRMSHHNNLSVLIVCHELYPKGKNSVLLREQLTGVHLHSLTNSKKAISFVRNYLNDKGEEEQFKDLFSEYVSRVNPVASKTDRRGSIIVKFNVPSVQSDRGRKAIGRFITFNDKDHAIVHENSKNG